MPCPRWPFVASTVSERLAVPGSSGGTATGDCRARFYVGFRWLLFWALTARIASGFAGLLAVLRFCGSRWGTNGHLWSLPSSCGTFPGGRLAFLGRQALHSIIRGAACGGVECLRALLLADATGVASRSSPMQVPSRSPFAVGTLPHSLGLARLPVGDAACSVNPWCLVPPGHILMGLVFGARLSNCEETPKPPLPPCSGNTAAAPRD